MGVWPDGISPADGWTHLAARKVVKGKRDEHDFILRHGMASHQPTSKYLPWGLLENRMLDCVLLLTAIHFHPIRRPVSKAQ